MDRTRVTQQTTSSTISLRSELAHDAPTPKALHAGNFHGPLQWALEGAGWGVVRPIIDFAMVWLALVIALGGFGNVVNADEFRAPLLLFPFLVVLLFYLRGLYRTQAAHAGARRHRAGHQRRLGGRDDGRGPRPLRSTDQVPEQGMWARAWFYALVAVGLGRIALALAQRWARAKRLIGQARADHGRGRRRRAGRAPAGEPPGVRARAGRLPRRGPTLGRRGGRPRGARAGHDRRPRGDGRTDGRQVPDRRLLLGRRCPREPADPALPGTRSRRRGGAAHVRH